MTKIVVLGSYNVGLSMFVSRLPQEGETVLGGGFSEGPGGKGSNQAVAARRLGADVDFVGCVGRDRFGDEAFKLWEREGVGHEFVRRSDNHTGVGLVIVDEKGENLITVDPGANADLAPSDVDRAEGVIASSPFLLLQFESPEETALWAAEVARRHGAQVILNPAPARRITQGLLRTVDYLTPNQSEFNVLVGKEPGEEVGFDVESAFFLNAGVKAVIVTLGDRGAYVATRDGGYMVPAPKVEAVDPTGAGDAFNGALAVALAEGKPLKEAVSFACFAGALTTTKHEVVPALPHRWELDGFRSSHVLE
jgi:ribokinase